MRAFGIADFGAWHHFDDLPAPAPEATDVLVRVRAAGVNPVDWNIASGKLHSRVKEEVRGRLPFALGMDLSGVGPADVMDYERSDAAYPNDVDVLVDLLGDRQQLPGLLRRVRRGGRAAVVRVPPEDVLSDRQITAETIMAVCTTERLTSVASLVASGRMQLPAIRTYPLRDAAEAPDEGRRGHVRGQLGGAAPRGSRA